MLEKAEVAGEGKLNQQMGTRLLGVSDSKEAVMFDYCHEEKEHEVCRSQNKRVTEKKIQTSPATSESKLSPSQTVAISLHYHSSTGDNASSMPAKG